MPEIASSAAPAPDDTLLRGRLLWLVAAPAGAAALLFAVTAGYFWAGGADRSDLVLIVGFLAAVVGLVIAAGQAVSTVRNIEHRVAPLRAVAADAREQADVARAQAESARAQAEKALGEAAAARDELADARAEGTAALTEAAGYRAAATDARAEIETLSERVRLAEERPVPVRTSAGRQVEVFVNLSRRLQSLVHREIKLLDALENEVEDPDLLKGLFQVDHLATRIRRHAENLAVLGGAVSRRQWSRPVALTEVLRSAIAEVEHYSRVKLVPPIDGTVPGHAVASIIHLVAELIENATMFAPPQTQVLLRAQHVTAGVVVEVEDRGLGMQREDQERVNRLLLNPEDINLDELLRDGRIGLFVVSMIARQHGVTVQLQGNIYGGTQAVIVLPQHLLGSAQDTREPAAVHHTLAANGLPQNGLPQNALPQNALPQNALAQNALAQNALAQNALPQNALPQNALAPNALSQQTMELAQRVPGPSQIAAPPPTWPAFAALDTAPSLVSATPAPASALPASATPYSATPIPAPGFVPAPAQAPTPDSGAVPDSGPAPASAMPAPGDTLHAEYPVSGPAWAAATPSPGDALTSEKHTPAPTSATPAPNNTPHTENPASVPAWAAATPTFTSQKHAPAPTSATPALSDTLHPEQPASATAPASATPALGNTPGFEVPLSGAPVFASPASGAVVPADPAAAPHAVPYRAVAEAAEGRPAVIPPPLPRRHSQTHLAPQLQFGPPAPLPDHDGGHDPALMASFLQGVSRSEAGTPTAPATPVTTHTPAMPATTAAPTTPAATAAPHTPDASAMPGTPTTPDASVTPGTPTMPGTPTTPGTPNVPDVPGATDQH